MPLLDLSLNEDIDSINSIVTSEPLKDAPGMFVWRIIARSLYDALIEADKVNKAVNDDGFVFFTMPHQLKSGKFKLWFQLIGITYK